MKKTMIIEGMMCMHCAAHVKEALSKVKGVKDVKVSLDENNAVIEEEGAKDEDLKAAVVKVGYTPVEVR